MAAPSVPLPSGALACCGYSHNDPCAPALRSIGAGVGIWAFQTILSTAFFIGVWFLTRTIDLTESRRHRFLSKVTFLRAGDFPGRRRSCSLDSSRSRIRTRSPVRVNIPGAALPVAHLPAHPLRQC